jgi:hypothetical protein
MENKKRTKIDVVQSVDISMQYRVSAGPQSMKSEHNVGGTIQR